MLKCVIYTIATAEWQIEIDFFSLAQTQLS